jgi:hypothetical protein
MSKIEDAKELLYYNSNYKKELKVTCHDRGK